MKRSLISLLHLGFWLGYLLCLIFLMFVISQWEDVQPEDYQYYAAFFAGVAIVPAISSFYGNYHFLFSRYLQNRRWGLSLAIGLGIAAISACAGFLTIALGSEEALNCLSTCFPYGGSFTFGVAVLFGIIGLVLKGFLTWLDELKLKEELVEKNHKMELALVKSQLDPHFLFNTINNIDVLITKDPAEASRYLNKLSDMMRFMLYETKTEEVPLQQELQYIEKFVELQRIRTANPNYVQYAVAGATEQKMVAPMIFIPFIENAFKHTSNKKQDHAIAIDIQIEPEQITFRCANKYETNGQASKNGSEANGLGNELIERRLQLLYPDAHELKVDHHDGHYRVELSLQHAVH